jgi:hypothetical protein
VTSSSLPPNSLTSVNIPEKEMDEFEMDMGSEKQAAKRRNKLREMIFFKLLF